MKINNFKKKLLCWGAADQCEVIRPIISSLGAKFDILVDDTPGKKSPFEEVELLGGKSHFENWASNRDLSEYGFVIAIGNPYGHVRIQLHEYLSAKGLSAVSFADASAIIDADVTIEDGAQVMRGSYVNTKVKIGRQCILNTKSLVEHHCVLENGVEIGPSATLCGRVQIGQNTWIGANATVLPYLSIEKNVIVGAGSVVTKSILQHQTVHFGNPARFQRNNHIISST